MAWLYQKVLMAIVGIAKEDEHHKETPKKTKIAFKHTIRTENHGHMEGGPNTMLKILNQ